MGATRPWCFAIVARAGHDVWGTSMGGWGVGIGSRMVAAVIVLIAVMWLALWYFIPAPPSTITIAAGLKGGAFEHIANRYRDILEVEAR